MTYASPISSMVQRNGCHWQDGSPGHRFAASTGYPGETPRRPTGEGGLGRIGIGYVAFTFLAYHVVCVSFERTDGGGPVRRNRSFWYNFFSVRRPVPTPASGGLVLSYRCTSRCRHCIYACGPEWAADWISQTDLEQILSTLAGKLLPAPGGPENVGLNHGLHFTGGEPFANFELLLSAVSIAKDLSIPSTFVETNCFFAKDMRTTREMLSALREKGLKGIMISVNPFYLEAIPFERTERAIETAHEIFGRNTMVYQAEYYRRFREWGLFDRVPFEKYLDFESRWSLFRNVGFFLMGRAPYRLGDLLGEFLPLRSAEDFFREPCRTPFLRSLHNHFDNYGNYVPGFCAGISLGDARKLDALLEEGVDTEERPVLVFLMDGDLAGLFRFAKERGYAERAEGYFSRCHLCTDLRRHLAEYGEFPELAPAEFYRHLEP